MHNSRAKLWEETDRSQTRENDRFNASDVTAVHISQGEYTHKLDAFERNFVLH